MPEKLTTTLTEADRIALAKEIVNLQESRAAAKKAVELENFQNDFSIFGKFIHAVRPYQVLIWIITGLVSIGWFAYSVYNSFAPKDFVQKQIEMHAEGQHQTTIINMRSMRDDIDSIDENVKELKEKSNRDDMVQELQMLRTKYVESLAEFNSRGRRGKRPKKDERIGELESMLLR